MKVDQSGRQRLAVNGVFLQRPFGNRRSLSSLQTRQESNFMVTMLLAWAPFAGNTSSHGTLGKTRQVVGTLLQKRPFGSLRTCLRPGC